MDAKTQAPRLAPLPAELGLIDVCANCIFWQRERQENGPQGAIATCRRFPPQSVLQTQIHKHPITGAPMPQQMPTTLPQPVTFSSAWCGEYKRDPKPAPDAN